jgi:hypothetical protein
LTAKFPELIWHGRQVLRGATRQTLFSSLLLWFPLTSSDMAAPQRAERRLPLGLHQPSQPAITLQMSVAVSVKSRHSVDDTGTWLAIRL